MTDVNLASSPACTPDLQSNNWDISAESGMESMYSPAHALKMGIGYPGRVCMFRDFNENAFESGRDNYEKTYLRT